MNIVIAEKTFTTQIDIAAGSTKNKLMFPDIELLNGKWITSLETFVPEIIPVGIDGTSLANSLLMAASYVNLVVGDDIVIWNMPLLKLVTLNNQFMTGVASQQFQVEFNNLKIIWSKSFISIVDISLIDPAIDQQFLFNISYSDPK